MNRPLLAGILVAAVVLSLAWFVWFATREPRRSVALVSLAVWAIPLFYAGGWSAGATTGETTLVLLLVITLVLLRVMRDNALDWPMRHIERRRARLGQSSRAGSTAPEENEDGST
ncbi:MAG: hypothetical protein WCL10_08925 [Novosphingobium sp.]|uniref:hypothetical protein n=1 Tax=Novosphingobium sp. TaxID=1874826 RepID=UPI0030186466